MIGFESDRVPVLKKIELANWTSPGSVRSYNPIRLTRQKHAYDVKILLLFTSSLTTLPFFTCYHSYKELHVLNPLGFQ